MTNETEEILSLRLAADSLRETIHHLKTSIEDNQLELDYMVRMSKAKHPDWSVRVISDILGVPASRVHRLTEGYRSTVSPSAAFSAQVEPEGDAEGGQHADDDKADED